MEFTFWDPYYISTVCRNSYTAIMGDFGISSSSSPFPSVTVTLLWKKFMTVPQHEISVYDAKTWWHFLQNVFKFYVALLELSTGIYLLLYRSTHIFNLYSVNSTRFTTHSFVVGHVQRNVRNRISRPILMAVLNSRMNNINCCGRKCQLPPEACYN